MGLGDIQEDRSIIAMIVITTEGNETSVDETLDKRQKTMSDDLLSMLRVSTSGQCHDDVLCHISS